MNVASFYRFAPVCDPDRMCAHLERHCRDAGLLGTILVAAEGVNGTLAGPVKEIEATLDLIGRELGLDIAPEARWTDAASAPFERLRVKVKKEIVTLGRPDIRPDRHTAKHVDAGEWNALIDDPDTLVIDTRNHYEVEVGTFPNAIDPGTDSFREFPDYAASLADADRDRSVAMFCTGGIRCEKASALLLEMGFSDVRQLQGGILKYLESVAADDNRWQGECFVFDKRVAVDRDRAEGGYVQCHACRRPLGSQDLASPHYREGVSCPNCVDELDRDRLPRLKERRKQVRLAAERGQRHIGARPTSEPKKA